MKSSLKEMISLLCNNQRFAVIATVGKNKPYTNLVAFLATNDLKKIYFPTLINTKKFENLTENSNISLLIDNRENSLKDIQNATTVAAMGSAKEIQGMDILYKFIEKHPYLKEFVDSSDCVMIEINVKKYIVVTNFQLVHVLNI